MRTIRFSHIAFVVLASFVFTLAVNAATTYSISPSPASGNENAGPLSFWVTRSGDLPAETIFVSTIQDQGFTNV